MLDVLGKMDTFYKISIKYISFCTLLKQAQVIKVPLQGNIEATFQLKLANVTKMEQVVFSPEYYVRKVPWTIQARTSIANGVKNLGFFINCEVKSESAWECKAEVELRLLSQYGGESLKRSFCHLFLKKEKNLGYTAFISWTELLKPNKGFIKHDSVILEAYVKADVPVGEDF